MTWFENCVSFAR